MDYIGMCAFSQTKLSEVRIPASVQEVGANAFSWCRGLESVRFEAGSRLREIGYKAFMTVSIREVQIPACVSVIRPYAFSNCANLESVTFGEGSQLEVIMHCAFSHCGRLLSIAIPSGATVE